MTDPRRLTIILHAKAAGQKGVQDAVSAISRKGHLVDVKVTEGPGDGERFSHQAAKAAAHGEVDTIVSGGGDGTLNAVIHGALEAGEKPQCSFALMPLGTANDFAQNAAIPLDPAEALDVALTAPARATDVAGVKIDGRQKPQAFVNMATAGFGPRVTSEADPDLKEKLGGAAYLLSALARIGEVTPWAGRIRADGFSWEGSFAALAVGNGRRAGGGVELCPLAELDDGALDLTIIEAPDGDILAGLVSSLPMAVGLQPDSVTRARASAFEVETDNPVPLSLDGEMLEASRFTFSVQRHAIRFHLPDPTSRL
ncbi:YegS/Rv2252/BmrU family lipid kinase [Breoghania sp.]|uniref:YegS/Rv2252/BmrU family lipid kinase n=1 Tax=Breoghania sp. TaxID=2065378 RepID=UPI002AA7245B|nr:YegS/Rv2252/BmrU family lipid kinase [Breoghania sp.]